MRRGWRKKSAFRAADAAISPIFYAGPQNYLSQNPHFCKSALSRYTPRDFLALLKRYRIAYHEKHKGQLFCDNSAEDIISMLKAECAAGGVHWRMPCKVSSVGKNGALFRIDSDAGTLAAANLVIASGGLSIPKIGASDFAYRVARQFDVAVVEPRPGLVPLTFDPDTWQPFGHLAGVALPVAIEAGAKAGRGHFFEDLLFTHRGLSGPAVLQISSYWHPGTPLILNLLPETDVAQALIKGKTATRKNLDNVLGQWLPARLAEGWLAAGGFRPDARLAGYGRSSADATRRLAEQLEHPAERHGRLPQGGGHARRRRYARLVAAKHDGAESAGPVFHRRGGRRHRLAGRLQFPVGLGFGGSGGIFILSVPPRKSGCARAGRRSCAWSCNAFFRRVTLL